MKLWESGVWRFCSTLPVQKPPAVSRRSSSSSRVLSVAVSSSAKHVRVQSHQNARSCVCLSNRSSMLPPFFSWEAFPSGDTPLIHFFYYTTHPRREQPQEYKNPALHHAVRDLRVLLQAKPLVEPINTSTGVNQLLLAGIERVALGADLNTNVLLGRTSGK